MATSIATWHDLSHAIRPDMARVATFPAPVIDRILSRPQDAMNVTRIDLCCHVGTHIDAPGHFIDGGATIDQLGPDRFSGPGVVLRVPAESYGEIGAQDLEDAEPRTREGDIVLLDTGWSDFVGTPRYEEHPSLTEDAAGWLVERGARVLGVDFGTPDLALSRRQAGFGWPVHHILLGHDVLIAEHVTRLRPLAGRRVEVVCLPLNIAGADGAPARIVARPVDVEADGHGPDAERVA